MSVSSKNLKANPTGGIGSRGNIITLKRMTSAPGSISLMRIKIAPAKESKKAILRFPTIPPLF